MPAENVETTKVTKKTKVVRGIKEVDADLKTASDKLARETDRCERTDLKCEIDDLLDERLLLSKK